MVAESFYDTDKVFRHVLSIRIRFLFYRLTLLGKSRETRKELERAWLDRLTPVGSGVDSPDFMSSRECLSDPLTSEPWGCGTVIKKFVGPDESDYNMHLSNSSYPKVCPRHEPSLLIRHGF